MNLSRLARATGVGVLLLLLLPDAASAWGPGTHVFLGVEALASLDLLGPAAAALLRAHPLEFLYGSLAADISMAKKYAPVGRHCHHWHVAREIDDSAEGEPELRAVTTGYLTHLAADIVAHNSFVPRMLLLTSSTQALGHSYWEHRMDARVGPEYVSLARRVVTELDHSRADALFDDVLSHTLFSFRTNRRIFRGLIRMTDYQRWQTIFDTVIEQSRWELDDHETERFLGASFNRMIALLRHGQVPGDPTGEAALEEAKRERREVLRHEGWSTGLELRDRADRLFPVPEPPGGAWRERGGTREEAERILEPPLRKGAAEGARP